MAGGELKPRINIVTLGVSDIAKARQFYERLGLNASSSSNESVAFFDANGIVLALFGHHALAEDAHAKAGPAPEFRGVSLAWNAASPEETDRIYAHALAAGARGVKEPQKVFWGGYSGYFADLDGHLWEVAHNPFFPLDRDGRIELP